MREAHIVRQGAIKGPKKMVTNASQSVTHTRTPVTRTQHACARQ